MSFTKEDQDKIIKFLENKMTGEQPLEDTALFTIIALIKTGMMDWIMSGNDINEFVMMSVGQMFANINAIFENEEFMELLDAAYDNAVIE